MVLRKEDMSEEYNKEWEPKIVAFLCNWCSYAGADLAGTSRLQYPPGIRIVRVPCSGRINPIYIINALLDCADGVLVSGCHPGDCHYLSGNLYARRRFTVLKKMFSIVGIEPERVQFTWVSASEGNRFAEVIKEVTEGIAKIGPNPVITAMGSGSYAKTQSESANGAIPEAAGEEARG